MTRIFISAGFIFFIVGIFGFGFASGHYPNFPLHFQVLNLKDALLSKNSFLSRTFREQALGDVPDNNKYDFPDSIWFKNYFSRQLDKSYPLVYQPVRNLADLEDVLDKIGLRKVPAEAFYTATETIANIR